jgi:hypothetical protein
MAWGIAVGNRGVGVAAREGSLLRVAWREARSDDGSAGVVVVALIGGFCCSRYNNKQLWGGR